MRSIKKTIIGLLCFTLSWTTVVPAYAKTPESLSDIYEKYPNARVIHVSQQDYPALAYRLAQNGYRSAGVQVALREGRELDSRDVAAENASAPGATDDCNEEYREARSPDASIHISNSRSSGGGSGDAEFLFIVIGAVVVVVWTIYAIKYLADLAIGRHSCGAWSDLAFSSNWGAGDNDASTWFGGVRYLTGVRDGATHFGLAGEIGQSHIQLPAQSLDVHGIYWLLGPLLRWHIGGASSNPHYFQMEFLAGSTENDEVGIIAQAKAGFNFAVGRHFRWGVNIGALNINLNETEGIIGERSQYHSLVGFEWGYRF